MISKIRIISSFLNEKQGGAAFTIPDELKSKEELTKQTDAVEKLVKDTIVSKLPEYSDKVYSVGGFVRDRLLGRNPKDLDLVVEDPEQQMKAAEVFANKLVDALGIRSGNNPHPLKEAFGIWGVALLNPIEGKERKPFVYDGVDITGYVIEITPPRKEGPYDSAKRAPSYVNYTPLEDDAKRRDLTINALYQNIVTGEIKDFVGGMQDIKDQKLKPPEHPGGIKKIYEEDPLRIMRLIRFEGKLPGFTIDPQTKDVIKEFVAHPEGHKNISERLSKERIRDELEQILVNKDSNKAVEGLNLMKDLGFLKYLSPEFDKLLNVYHDKVYHKGESVWDHTMEVLSKTPPTLKARLAALFHDVGKIYTKSEDIDKEGRPRVHFLGHEQASAAITDKILRELTFDNKIVSSVKSIVQSHMGFKNFEEQKPNTQKRSLRVYIEKLHDDLDDALAILKADAKDADGKKKVEEIEVQLKKLMEEDKEKGLLVKKDKYEYAIPLSGDEIKAQFQLEGKTLGAVIARLKKLVMEGRMGDPDIEKRKAEARKLITSIVKDKNALDALVKSYDEKKKGRDFFIKKACVRNVLSQYFKEESPVDMNPSNETLPELILTVGISGSGKSTWIKSQQGFEVVSPDEIRRSLGDVSDQSKMDDVFSIAYNKLRTLLSQGKNVIFDATNLESKYRMELIKSMPKHISKAKVFHTDPEEAKKRIKMDLEKGVDRSNVSDYVVDRMYRNYQKTVNEHQLENEGFEIVN